MKRRVLLQSKGLIGEPPGRIAPLGELVNAFEFENMAKRKLDGGAFALISGSDRGALDRITFRPRTMVNTLKMDLSVELFGRKMFMPILIGPASEQKRFHPEGELAMARGAAAAKAVMVIAGRSSYPLDQIMAETKGAFWYQVDSASAGSVPQAVKSGCGAVCFTVSKAQVDWRAVERARHGLSVPFVLKGVMTPDEARKAIEKGADGIVVSNYERSSAGPAPIEALAAIADAVAAKIPILADGGFRRGSDVLKALALGAQAILLGRAPLWGLASYGADGVRTVVELIQNELARDMAMCGKVSLKDLNRSVIKIHRR